MAAPPVRRNAPKRAPASAPWHTAIPARGAAPTPGSSGSLGNPERPGSCSCLPCRSTAFHIKYKLVWFQQVYQNTVWHPAWCKVRPIPPGTEVGYVAGFRPGQKNIWNEPSALLSDKKTSYLAFPRVCGRFLRGLLMHFKLSTMSDFAWSSSK